MTDNKQLVKNLYSDDGMTRAQAESELYNASQDVVPYLLETIQQSHTNENEKARRVCAWIIYKIGHRITDPQLRGAAVNALIAALEDQDAGLRKNAAWGLSAIGSSSAVQPLRAASQDMSADVRDAVEYALQQISSRS
ncbi:MAG: HEAT repeat domain-containing protein [Anaerolineae bacterium]|nr:HEAT repeat domain-containing protein [Anaerolineae bacterium]